MAAVSAAGAGSLGSSGSVGIKPSRVWYGVAVAIFVGSLVPVFFLARSAFDTLSLGGDPVGDDGAIEVRDRGLSVFAPGDVSEPGPISCTVNPSDGGRPVSLVDELGSASINGYEKVGSVPDDLPAGTYGLRCTDGDTVIDVDEFGTQSTEGWPRAILQVVIAVVIAGAAGLTAITIAVITAVRRSSARRRQLRPPPPPPYGSAGFPSAPTPKS
jgi:hypothetical protein